MTRYEGGCHCGRVRFRVEAREPVALECNCSICRKKGFLHVTVERQDFELLSGEQELVSYRFNTGVAEHRFCRVCGVESFYVPRSHPDGISTNLRCFDGDAMSRFEIRPFDGDNWEDNVESIR